MTLKKYFSYVRACAIMSFEYEPESPELKMKKENVP